MSLGSVPCSCGGENPNCFRCWGTGMVESKSPELPSSGTYLGSRLSKKGSNRLPMPCPECGISVMGLVDHLQKVHAKSAGKKKNKSRPTGGRRSYVILVDSTTPKTSKDSKSQRNEEQGLHLCPVCGVAVKSLTRHFNRTGHSSAGRTIPTGKPANKTTSQSERCPRCGARFSTPTQLSSHVMEAHGRVEFLQLERATSGNHRMSRGVTEAEQYLPQRENTQHDGQLDAKRYWGHSFRDHGQFGSYPSHDDMDDESSA